MLMYRYMLVLFFCLPSLHIHGAPLKSKKLSPTQIRNAKIDIALQISEKLPSKLLNEHKYLAPAISLLHEALVLKEPGFQHNNAIATINSRRRFIEKNKLSAIHIAHFRHHQPSFLQHLIIDAQDLDMQYPKAHGSALKHKLYNDVERAIGNICDPLSQELVQQKFNTVRQKIEQHVFQKRAVYPNKITAQEARQQKIALMQFANYALNSQEDEDHPDTQDALSFATLHNIAITCLEREFSQYNANQITALIAKYSLNPIDIATARQYAANNAHFFKSLIISFHGIQLPQLLNTTEELLEKLPKELYDQLYERGLDDLEIDMRD